MAGLMHPGDVRDILFPKEGEKTVDLEIFVNIVKFCIDAFLEPLRQSHHFKRVDQLSNTADIDECLS